MRRRRPLRVFLSCGRASATRRHGRERSTGRRPRSDKIEVRVFERKTASATRIGCARSVPIEKNMSEGDAAWSGWGAPPRSQACATPSDAETDLGGRAHAQPTTTTLSKNKMRRQRRGLAGNDPGDRADCQPIPHAPLSDYADGDLYQRRGHDHCDKDARDKHREDEYTQAEGGNDAVRPLAPSLPLCDRAISVAAIADAIQSPLGVSGGPHEGDLLLGDERDRKVDTDDTGRGWHFERTADERRSAVHGMTLLGHQQRASDNNARDESDDATASDGGDDDDSSDVLENHNEPNDRPAYGKENAGRDHNPPGDGGRAHGTADRALAVAHGSHKSRRRSEASEGALTRILVKSRPSECSPSAAIVAEGDVISCRTCGVSSTTRRSSRMGVYVGDGWVVHAVQRRQRGASAHDDPYYEIVQQTLQDFAQGRTLSADEWFRTRSEFPAAVRVRRALERVGAEWEVPEGLDNARVSEDFALWTATGQSALTHADYRDDRDDRDSATTAPLAYRSSSLSRRKRNRRNSDDRGVVARAVRVGYDSPPPVLARIHQPATSSCLSAASLASSAAARPAPIASDYRHAVAGGIVGLYLGGPIGGAVGGAAGLLLDSMASLGRGWRS